MGTTKVKSNLFMIRGRLAKDPKLIANPRGPQGVEIIVAYNFMDKGNNARFLKFVGWDNPKTGGGIATELTNKDNYKMGDWIGITKAQMKPDHVVCKKCGGLVPSISFNIYEIDGSDIIGMMNLEGESDCEEFVINLEDQDGTY